MIARFDCKAVLLTVVLLAGVCVQAAAQTMESITVSDPRPVAAAIQELEQRYGLIISYEDPEYVFAGDLQDVTAAVRRDLDKPGPHPAVIVPRGPALHFAYPVSNGKPQEEMTALLARMLAEYAKAGGAVFRVQQRTNKWGRMWEVVPAEVRDKNGRMVTAKPVLDYGVSISTEERTAMQMFALICRELSQVTGRKIERGTVPLNAFFALRVQMGADVSQPAREVLEKLLGKFMGPLSWSLFYDPGTDAYFLNIDMVPVPAAAQ